MNSFNTSTGSRFYSVALAAFFTVAMLMSVDSLATGPQVAAHMAQVQLQAQAGAHA